MDAGLFSETWDAWETILGNEETCMRRMESDKCYACGSLNPIGLHLDITEGEGWPGPCGPWKSRM